MPANPTPRQILASLLQGAPPSRPLLLPIVFSLGAKIENVSPHDFLGNATKISNSLRQIRTHLRSDGVACYFDPALELEALGASPHREADGRLPAITSAHSAGMGTLPRSLRSPGDAAKSPGVKVAVEVISRLKSSFRDEPLLMAGVTGPFTLAARLAQLDRKDALRAEDLPASALDAAASVITAISSAFVEAGANLIFMQEEILPALSAETCQAWASLLAPTLNIVRFYEALPVLQLSRHDSFVKNAAVIFEHSWECVLCLPLEAIAHLAPEKIPVPGAVVLGISLPLASFQPDRASDEHSHETFECALADLKPVLLTTAGDVPVTTDLKHLMKIMQDFSRTSQAARKQS
jgi:hypothetical protein